MLEAVDVTSMGSLSSVTALDIYDRIGEIERKLDNDVQSIAKATTVLTGGIGAQATTVAHLAQVVGGIDRGMKELALVIRETAQINAETTRDNHRYKVAYAKANDSRVFRALNKIFNWIDID